MDNIFNLFAILLVLAIMVRLGRTNHSSGGGVIVKPKTDSNRPKVYPAPQEIRKNKKN